MEKTCEKTIGEIEESSVGGVSVLSRQHFSCCPLSVLTVSTGAPRNSQASYRLSLPEMVDQAG